MAQRRAPTGLCSFGTALTMHLRTRLSLSEASVVDRVHCTVRGGYRVEVPLPIASHVRSITSVDLQDWGMWTCRPTTVTDLPGPPRSPGLTAQHRRDSFVLVGVPLSEGDSDFLTAFASANARTLGLSPTTLQAHLISAERLRRRCPSGPEAGSWQPSTSIWFVGEPSIVRQVLAAPRLVLHFHAVEACPCTLPMRQCYHCGMQGHMS